MQALRRCVHRKHRIAILIFLLTANSACAADLSHVPQINETKEQRDDRMAWFRDAKFGMFIHWGPCSVGQKEIGWGREGNRPWDINQNGPRTDDPVYDNYFDAKCVRCHDGTEPLDLRATPVWDNAARKFWNQAYHALISTDRSHGPANDTSQLLGIIAEESRYLNWIGRWSVPEMIPPYSHGSSRSPLISLLKERHESVEMTQEERDKVSCWIDLALPHSGDWTEGMKPEDKEIYMRVYRKRLDWEKQEAFNIQEYLHAQAASQRSDRPDTE